jgi:hypothetical protein
MKLTEADLEFLGIAMMERIQQHYSTHHEETKADFERLVELEKPYQEVLSRLSAEDVQAVHAFHEHCFHMGANCEAMLYRCGVLDGLRLAKLLMELE